MRLRSPRRRRCRSSSPATRAPAFLARGTYVDTPFTCVDCGVAQVWTARQQKWWYEVAKGYVYSTAKRCRACRRKRRTPRSSGEITGRG